MVGALSAIININGLAGKNKEKEKLEFPGLPIVQLQVVSICFTKKKKSGLNVGSPLG